MRRVGHTMVRTSKRSRRNVESPGWVCEVRLTKGWRFVQVPEDEVEG